MEREYVLTGDSEGEIRPRKPHLMETQGTEASLQARPVG